MSRGQRPNASDDEQSFLDAVPGSGLVFPGAWEVAITEVPRRAHQLSLPSTAGRWPARRATSRSRGERPASCAVTIGDGDAELRLYRGPAPVGFFEICGRDEIPVVARIQATGSVTNATFPDDLPKNAQRVAEEVLAERLFMPAVENGRFVERKVAFTMRAGP